MARARLRVGRRGPASRAAIAAGAFGAFVAMTTAPSTTRAQGGGGGDREVGAVVYASAGAPVDEAALRAALARAALRAGARLEVRPLARAASRAGRSVDAARLDVFTRVERLVAEGWRGYLEARFGDAADRLDRARAEATALLDLDGGLELYAELSLRRGAVALTQGRDREADDDLRLAARLDPDRPVSDAEFKPAVVERHRAATARRPSIPRRLVADPPGATVEVDGQPAGAAPLDVQLEEGRHVLVARAPGRAPRAALVTIAPGDPPAIELRLDRDPRASALTDGVPRLRPGATISGAGEIIAAVVDLGELDGVLLAASVWRSGRPALLGQYCAGSPLVCASPVEVAQSAEADLDRAAAELWRQALAAAPSPSGEGPTLVADLRLVRGERAPDPARPRDAKSGPWWKSRWLWVGVGSAAVSAAAAGFILGTAGDDDRAWSPAIDPCEFGGC